jgi:DNA-binding transcriptional MerR regulator
LAESNKSDSAFRTISEVSEDLHVPQHVLRFWETKFSAIKPLKRGGNRRYYRPEDIQLLRAINTLLYVDGYTIRGVQKLLRDQGVRTIAAAKGGAIPVAAEDEAAPAIFADNTAGSAPNMIDRVAINQPALEFEPDLSTVNVGLFPLPVAPATADSIPVAPATADSIPVAPATADPSPEPLATLVSEPVPETDSLVSDAIARLEAVRARIKSTLG